MGDKTKAITNTAWNIGGGELIGKFLKLADLKDFRNAGRNWKQIRKLVRLNDPALKNFSDFSNFQNIANMYKTYFDSQSNFSPD